MAILLVLSPYERNGRLVGTAQAVVSDTLVAVSRSRVRPC
jgi:hypothetical protein